MSLEQRGIIIKAFIFSKLNYCPLVWKCHNKTLNNRINHLQDGTLRIVYRDQQSSFKELLEIDSSTKIHVRNHQYLIPEIFKVKKGFHLQ